MTIWKSETFQVGARVVWTELAKEKLGEKTKNVRDKGVVLGSSPGDLLRVRPDGIKSAYLYSPEFWKPEVVE